MPKDTILYDRLGISPDSTETQVKKAFINLSKQWHPDKHPDEMKEEASTKFKDITEAKDILIDENKRKTYDQIGMEMFKQQESSGGNGGGNPFGAGFPFGGNPFGGGFGFPFNMNFGQQPNQNNQRNVEPVIVNLKVTLEQLYKEEKVTITFKHYIDCNPCNGEGGSSEQCVSCRGQGKTVNIQQIGPMITQSIMDCGSCQGKGKIIKNECKKCNGKGTLDEIKVLNFPLSGQMTSGSKIQIPGEGNKFKDNKSDLIVVLEVPLHPIFKRTANNLIMEVKISLYEALFGFVKTVSFLDGTPITIESTNKTDYNTVKCIQGKGMTKDSNLCIIFTFTIPLIEKNKYKKMIKDILGEKDTINDQEPVYMSDVSNPDDILSLFLKMKLN